MSVKKNNIDDEIIASVQQSQMPDYKNEIVDIFRSNLTPGAIREKLAGYHENDIAAAMAELRYDERRKVYSILDIESLAEVLEYAEELGVYLGELGIRKRADVLSLLEVTTAAEYLKQTDKKERAVLIDLMEDEAKREIALLVSFDDDEIGSRMTTNYISIVEGISVREAMRELIAQAPDNDNISTIYVTDPGGTFVGGIRLKDLIMARDGTSLESIMTTSYPYVYANELIEDSIERIMDYSEDSIPILDENNRLKGVITASDVAELANDLFGDTYAKLGGLSAEEDLHEPVKKSIGKRLPWLIVLLGMGMIVSGVVGLFEEVVKHIAMIVCFQSLVLGMAGNVGTQSLAVTIRVLMDDEIGARQKLRLVAKEVRVGLLNGLILGVMAFAVIGGYLCITGEPILSAFAMSGCTGIALLVSMVLAGLAGTVIPIIFKNLKVDPAAASGPLITTINDLVGVVTYYGLSWVLLINVLGL